MCWCFREGVRAQSTVVITPAAALKSSPPPAPAALPSNSIGQHHTGPGCQLQGEGWGVREFSSSVSVVKIIKERRRL